MDETLEQRSQRIFGESLDVVIPRLFREGKGISRVAILLESQPNSVRHWLKTNGYAVTSKRVVNLHKVEPHA
jgi:hypothetical protein